MSRVEKQNSNYQIAYGLDHIAGLFVQVFDLSLKDDDADTPIVDLDEWTTPGLNVERIVAVAEEYGFDISNELTEKTIE